jgi:hypothetical protein
MSRPYQHPIATSSHCKARLADIVTVIKLKRDECSARKLGTLRAAPGSFSRRKLLSKIASITIPRS